MSYPGSIPSYAGFTGSHTLSADNHASQSNSEQADIIAIATKVGTGSSTPTNQKLLRGDGTGTSTWAQADLTTDVTGVLPVANGGTGGASASGARTSLGLNTQAEILTAVYPVGCIYIETTGTNPATTFGFGTWIAFGAGRTLIGVGTSDQAFAAAATGGESNHTLSIAEMPAHDHDPTNRYLTPDANDGSASANGPASWAAQTTQVTSSTGGGGTHNNLMPYIVTYFWRRTA